MTEQLCQGTDGRECSGPRTCTKTECKIPPVGSTTFGAIMDGIADAAAATAPDTEQDARTGRRERLAAKLRRLLDGQRLTEFEAHHLAEHVEAEQADGDQAREQLAELTEHRKAGDKECARLAAELAGAAAIAETNRTEADHRRTTLATALGCPNNATWDHLTAYARQTQKTIASLEQQIETERCRHEAAERDQAAIDVAAAEQAARAARQGEAEAIRARTAAEQRERDAERGVTNIRNEYEALLERWRQTCAELQRVKDGAGKAAAALRETENQLGEARKRNAKYGARVLELGTQVDQLTARLGEYADRGIENGERAERAEAGLLRVHEQRKEMAAERYASALRAERAEATLAAVRKLHENDRWHCGVCADEYGSAAPWPCPTAAALGDPQPVAPDLAAFRQPAYDAVSAYIGGLPSEGYGALPSSTVTRNAMIWRGVNAALDAITSGPPANPAETEVRELPLELDGAALWAAIRDVAARDAEWWRRIERTRSRTDRVRPRDVL